jgi:hypothetical protein
LGPRITAPATGSAAELGGTRNAGGSLSSSELGFPPPTGTAIDLGTFEPIRASDPRRWPNVPSSDSSRPNEMPLFLDGRFLSGAGGPIQSHSVRELGPDPEAFLRKHAVRGRGVSPDSDLVVFTNGISNAPGDVLSSLKQISSDSGLQFAPLLNEDQSNHPAIAARWAQRFDGQKMPLANVDGQFGQPLVRFPLDPDEVDPAYREVVQATNQYLGDRDHIVQEAASVIEAHADQKPPQDLHVFAFSQGTLIWRSAIEEFIDRRVADALTNAPAEAEFSAVEAKATSEARAYLAKHVTIETGGNVVKDWPEGPRYVHWVDPKDKFTRFLGATAGDDGLYVGWDGAAPEGETVHRPEYYFRLRQATLEANQVRSTAELLDRVDGGRPLVRPKS